MSSSVDTQSLKQSVSNFIYSIINNVIRKYTNLVCISIVSRAIPLKNMGGPLLLHYDIVTHLCIHQDVARARRLLLYTEQ